MIKLEDMERIDTDLAATYAKVISEEPAIKLYIQTMPMFHEGYDVFLKVEIGGREADVSVRKYIKDEGEALEWADKVVEFLKKGFRATEEGACQ